MAADNATISGVPVYVRSWFTNSDKFQVLDINNIVIKYINQGLSHLRGPTLWKLNIFPGIDYALKQNHDLVRSEPHWPGKGSVHPTVC